MFGPAFYIVGALAFLCVHSSSALTPTQANSVCALLPDGQNIANPADCSQFYLCTRGKATLNTCLGNNLFSKEDQTCVPPNQSSCGADDTDPCAFMSDGYFVSVPNSCSDYYYCEDGVGVKSSCEKGLNFDQANQACKYQSEYPCSDTESIPGDATINPCQVIQSGIYFGVASSCKAWQKCQLNGPFEIGYCPDPFVFNVDTQACDYKENVNCRQSQEAGAGGTSLEGTPCTTNGEFRADTTCAGYYVCTDGKYSLGKCINGQYFNPENNRCVSRLDAINNCDRCQGTKLQFVNLAHDNCTGYGVCSDGKMQSTGVCSNGYFSEISGGCVQTMNNPKFPVCYIPDDSETASSTSPPTEVSTTIDTTLKPDPTKPSDSKTTTPAESSSTTTEKQTSTESTSTESTSSESTSTKSTSTTTKPEEEKENSKEKLF